MKRLLLGIEILLPLVVAGCMLWVMCLLDFNPQVARFEKILDGTITFSSILVGFLAAMMGVLVSIRDSAIVQKIFDFRSKGYLAYYLSETIFLGFLVVVASGIMYPFIDNVNQNTPFIFWQLMIFWFIPSSIRIIIMMLLILFKSNVDENRPEGNNLTEEERQASRERNAKSAVVDK